MCVCVGGGGAFFGGSDAQFCCKTHALYAIYFLLSSVDSIVDLRDSRIFEIIIRPIPIYAATFSR